MQTRLAGLSNLSPIMVFMSLILALLLSVQSGPAFSYQLAKVDTSDVEPSDNSLNEPVLSHKKRLQNEQSQAVILNEVHYASFSGSITYLEKAFAELSEQINQAEPARQEHHLKLIKIWRETYQIHKSLAISPDLASQDEAVLNLSKQIRFLFNQISTLRAHEIQTHGAYQVYQGYNEDYINDLWREIESVPVRWFGIVQEVLSVLILNQQTPLSRKATVLHTLELMATEFSKAFLYLVLGFVLFRLTKKVTRKTKQIMTQMAKKGVHDKLSRSRSMSLRRFYPYFKWFIFLIYIYIGEYLLVNGRFHVLSFLVPYILYYAWFRIIRITITQVLASGVQFPDAFSLDQAQNKLSWTAKWLSLYAFWIVILIHTIKTITGEGLFFQLFNQASRVITFFVLVFIAYDWRTVLNKLTEIHLRGWPQKIAKELISGWRSLIFSLVLAVFFVLFISLSRLYRWSERFDIIRRLSANLFRRQIESSTNSASTNYNVPKDYKRAFLEANISKKNQLSNGQKEIYHSMRQAIVNWLNNDSDDKLSAIIGEQGSGKSQVAEFLLKEFESDYQTEIIKIQKRNILNAQLEDINALVNFQQDSESKSKKIIVIEQVENLFISTVGGFDVFITLLDKIQYENKQCFFIFVFNSHVWDYLDLKFKSVDYFAAIHKIPEWSEAEIKTLILAQHEISGYTLNFDEIIEAAKGESDYDSITYIEDKFFRLLREESKGNPAVAKDLWLGCLSYMGNNKLKVSIPKDRIDTMILPESFYFVLACIVRHWCINEADIIATTDLPPTVVRSVLKSCQKQGYISQANSSYKLNLHWQHSILSTLRRKNFIYS